MKFSGPEESKYIGQKKIRTNLIAGRNKIKVKTAIAAIVTTTTLILAHLFNYNPV